MIIYIDIETVKDNDLIKNYNIEKLNKKYGDKLNFSPETTKIVTITLGTTTTEGNAIKNLKGDEKEQIESFFKAISGNTICGFNIKGFDIPFIIKRAIYHKIKIPNDLKMYGKKPREMENIIDLFEVYKCGTFGGIGTLGLICDFLGITSPKDENIDGGQVQRYFDEGKVEEILEYCKKDVLATIELYNYFKEYNLI